jgi:hypothetical protein
VEKTTDLLQVTDKLYHIMYTSPSVGFKCTSIEVIGTDGCKSNYPFIYLGLPLDVIFIYLIY